MQTPGRSVMLNNLAEGITSEELAYLLVRVHEKRGSLSCQLLLRDAVAIADRETLDSRLDDAVKSVRR